MQSECRWRSEGSISFITDGKDRDPNDASGATVDSIQSNGTFPCYHALEKMRSCSLALLFSVFEYSRQCSVQPGAFWRLSDACVLQISASFGKSRWVNE